MFAALENFMPMLISSRTRDTSPSNTINMFLYMCMTPLGGIPLGVCVGGFCFLFTQNATILNMYIAPSQIMRKLSVSATIAIHGMIYIADIYLANASVHISYEQINVITCMANRMSGWHEYLLDVWRGLPSVVGVWCWSNRV